MLAGRLYGGLSPWRQCPRTSTMLVVNALHDASSVAHANGTARPRQALSPPSVAVFQEVPELLREIRPEERAEVSRLRVQVTVVDRGPWLPPVPRNPARSPRPALRGSSLPLAGDCGRARRTCRGPRSDARVPARGIAHPGPGGTAARADVGVRRPLGQGDAGGGCDPTPTHACDACGAGRSLTAVRLDGRGPARKGRRADANAGGLAARQVGAARPRRLTVQQRRGERVSQRAAG